MKKLMFLLVSLIAITASAQMRKAVVVVERQLKNPQTIAVNPTTRIRPSYGYYTLPYAVRTYHSDVTHNYNLPTETNKSVETPVWICVLLVVCALVFIYLIISEAYGCKQRIEPIEDGRCYHKPKANSMSIIELANGGGILIRGILCQNNGICC